MRLEREELPTYYIKRFSLVSVVIASSSEDNDRKLSFSSRTMQFDDGHYPIKMKAVSVKAIRLLETINNQSLTTVNEDLDALRVKIKQR